VSQPRALCALAAGAALLCLPLSALAADPVTGIGDAVVTPFTTRSGVAVADALWLPAGDGTIARLDRSTLSVSDTITLQGDPPAVAEALTSTDEGIWAGLTLTRAVALLDPGTGAEVRRVALDGDAYALAADGRDLWVVGFDSGALTRIDRGTGEVLSTVRDLAGPAGVAVGEGGVWVTANSSSRIVRVDPSSDTVTAQAMVPGRPHDLAVGLGGVWTANGRGASVSRLDPVTNEVVATIGMPAHAFDIEVLGDSVWVTSGPDDGCEDTSVVVRIDPGTNTIADSFPFPCAWALISDGTSLWVSGSDERGHLLAQVVVP
jgi:streptogramin lyase